MASSPPAGPSRFKRFARVGFPLLVIGFTAAGIAAVQLWSAPDWDYFSRNTTSMLLLLIGLVLLIIWFFLFSGLGWVSRLGIVAGLVIAALATVRDYHFSGNLVPVVHFRWQATADQRLEAQRLQAGRAEAPIVGDLSGNGPTDFPEFRGRLRDGIVTGPPLARDWQAKPPRQLWMQPCGGGYAAFALAGNVAVTIEQRRDQEAVVAYDTATGKERWVYAYPALFTEKMGGPGPRATPTIRDGEVYSLGATGILVCLKAATGELKWSVNILEGNANCYWGMSGSPLVYDNLVVVSPGVQLPSAAGRGVLAFNRGDGKLVWQAGHGKGGYSSPMLATLAGQRQVLVFDGEGISGYDPGDGKELWRAPWQNAQFINVAQPLVLDGDRVFISCGYGGGCTLLRVKRTNGSWTVETLWQNMNLKCQFTSPVAYQGHIYGLDMGILVCLDAETGERKWKAGRYDHGQLLLAGDLLVILSERGELALVEATPTAHRQLGIIPVFNRKTWNLPALADGKVYLRNDEMMACYDLTGN